MTAKKTTKMFVGIGSLWKMGNLTWDIKYMYAARRKGDLLKFYNGMAESQGIKEMQVVIMEVDAEVYTLIHDSELKVQELS